MSDYDPDGGYGSHSWVTVKCIGCKQRWHISFEKGEIDGFAELPITDEKEDLDDEEAQEEGQPPDRFEERLGGIV
jgi:hypothetical protein